MNIRVVKPADRDREFLADIAPFFMSKAVRKEMPYLDDKPNKTWLFAEEEGRIVGIASMSDERFLGEDVTLMGSLYVIPEKRACGVGHELIDARLKMARGGKDVRVVCLPALREAYRRRGFEVMRMAGKYAHMRRKACVPA